MMADTLYPKETPPRKVHPYRKWRVEYRELIYGGDGGGYTSSWDGYYRTKIGAKIAAFYHWYLGSWGGGTVRLYKNMVPLI